MLKYGSLAAVLAAGAFAFAQPPAPGHAQHNPAYEKCAKACADCLKECETCHAHCMAMLAAGKKEHHASAMTLSDCADVCAAAAKIVARGGPLAHQICDTCAKACDTCAAECEKFPADAQMKECARACRDCAKACRDMTAADKGTTK